MGDTGPNIAPPEPGSRPPDLSISEPAVHRGSSAVIEPSPTPLSTRNFPQATDKRNVFQENGLGVYYGSFGFSFRRIFAYRRRSPSDKLTGSSGHTTPWGAPCDTPSTSSVTPMENRGFVYRYSSSPSGLYFVWRR